MKHACFFTLVSLVTPCVHVYAQNNPPDTLWTIHIQLHDDPAKGKNRVLHYKYRETVYRYPSQRKAFVNDLLVPLVEKSANPAAQESLSRYFRLKTGKAVLGYTWLCGATAGTLFLTSALLKTILSPLSLSQNDELGIERDVRAGSILMAVGWASGIAFIVIAPRSKRFLHQTIDQYNQSLQRRITWQVGPSGTGLGLVGKF